MTAPTTPATPVQVYALAEGTKFGIPKGLDELDIATKQEVEAAATAGRLLARGANIVNLLPTLLATAP